MLQWMVGDGDGDESGLIVNALRDSHQSRRRKRMASFGRFQVKHSCEKGCARNAGDNANWNNAFLFSPPGTLAPCRPIRTNLHPNRKKIFFPTTNRRDSSLGGLPTALARRSVSLTSFKTRVASNPDKTIKETLPSHLCHSSALESNRG